MSIGIAPQALQIIARLAPVALVLLVAGVPAAAAHLPHDVRVTDDPRNSGPQASGPQRTGPQRSGPQKSGPQKGDPSDRVVTGVVRGLVIDARTGQPIARVRVALQPVGEATPDARREASAQVDTLTGADGRFRLDAPVGRAMLTVSAVGYSLARQPIIVAAASAGSPGAGDGSTITNLTIALTEGTGVYSEHVQVTGESYPRRDPGVPAEQTLGSGDLQNLKSLIADDPMRAVQALPGVAATDDLRAEFSIRGSDFRHIGVALDGVPSPLLVHTVHGVRDTGSLAMINSDILESVTLSAGSYPQRFGDRTGAFVDFRTRDGARDRLHARASVSAVNATGLIEGPIGSGARGSWLVSARQSYADWIVERIDPNVTGTFRFTDAQGKVAYALSPRHTLHLNFVAGTSRFDEQRDRFGLNSLDIGTNRAGIASASLRSTLSPAQTVTQRVYAVAGRYHNTNPEGRELGRGSSRDLSYRLDATRLLSARLLLEAGGHLQWQRAAGVQTTFDRFGAFVRPFRGTASRQSAYGFVRWEPTPGLTLSPGARVDRWSQTDETRVSPWLQTEWRLPRAWTVSAGGGLYRQAPELEETDGPRGSRDLRAARAWHADAGVGQRVGPWRWQATLFLREERDLLRLPDSEPYLDALGLLVLPSYTTRYENAVSASSHGLELFLYRRGPNGLSGWIGYAYANTELHDLVRDERYPADLDQRHTFNAYARYRLSDRLSLSTRFRAGSNMPIPGYLAPSAIDAWTYLVTDERNRLRLPTYSRLDVRADRTFTTGRSRLTLFAEVLNVYNRRNARALSPIYVSAGGPLLAQRVSEKLFPIIPSIGVTVEF